ncbi:MAG: hypothetical protein Q8P86_03755 [bacterium]|nr:hypothetical protein [bacterium]
MEEVSLWILKKAPAWFVSWSFRKIFGKKNLAVFERLLELPKWKKVSFGPNEKWIFEDDNSFVIEISDDSRDFTQAWTKRFPDKNAFATEVSLKISGELIHKTLLFVGVDGWRSFVPCPKVSEAFEEQHFYWDKSSVEYRVFERIGFLDTSYKNIEDFGKRCGVLIE